MMAMITKKTTQVRADVKCYYCGFVSGELLGEPKHLLSVKNYHPAPGSKPPRPGDSLRCARCGGPVYLDDVSPVKVQYEEDIRPQRSGRPRRRPQTDIAA